MSTIKGKSKIVTTPITPIRIYVKKGIPPEVSTDDPTYKEQLLLRVQEIEKENRELLNSIKEGTFNTVTINFTLDETLDELEEESTKARAVVDTETTTQKSIRVETTLTNDEVEQLKKANTVANIQLTTKEGKVYPLSLTQKGSDSKKCVYAWNNFTYKLLLTIEDKKATFKITENPADVDSLAEEVEKLKGVISTEATKDNTVLSESEIETKIKKANTPPTFLFPITAKEEMKSGVTISVTDEQLKKIQDESCKQIAISIYSTTIEGWETISSVLTYSKATDVEKFAYSATIWESETSIGYTVTFNTETKQATFIETEIEQSTSLTFTGGAESIDDDGVVEITQSLTDEQIEKLSNAESVHVVVTATKDTHTFKLDTVLTNRTLSGDNVFFFGGDSAEVLENYFYVAIDTTKKTATFANAPASMLPVNQTLVSDISQDGGKFAEINKTTGEENKIYTFTLFNKNGEKIKELAINYSKLARSQFVLDRVAEAGFSITLEMDENYIVKANLYDKNKKLISTSNAIDFPCEEIVVDGAYNETTGKIVLTLKNGKTIEIPVEKIIQGLATKTYVDTQDKALQDQITANATAITTEVTNRTNADNNLQTQITTNKTNIETNANDIATLKSDKQDKADNSLMTTKKTVVEAINEVNSEVTTLKEKVSSQATKSNLLLSESEINEKIDEKITNAEDFKPDFALNTSYFLPDKDGALNFPLGKFKIQQETYFCVFTRCAKTNQTDGNGGVEYAFTNSADEYANTSWFRNWTGTKSSFGAKQIEGATAKDQHYYYDQENHDSWSDNLSTIQVPKDYFFHIVAGRNSGNQRVSGAGYSGWVSVKLFLKQAVRFYISSTTYYAVSGMTWEQAIKENLLCAMVMSNGRIMLENQTTYLYYSGSYVKATDKIVAGATYELKA